MRFTSWLRNLNSAYGRSIPALTGAGRRPTVRPRLEVLEDRCTPSTYLVSNLKDAGAGSLRQAVINANNHAGPDTVVFKAGLEGTIKLTSGRINITGALFLDGPGANKITLDGNQNGRIFEVLAPSTVKVTLDGLTLFNGKTDGQGGAIFNEANLYVIGMVITGNTADLGGGAINSFGSNLTIQKSRIIGNTASNGGGIVAWSKTLIEDSTISGNQATNVGGGIYVFNQEGTSLTLRRSTVAGNLATTDGGGILVDFSVASLTIENSTIEGNQAGRYGGGVNSAASVTRVTDSRIRYNLSESTGGGLAAGFDVQIRRSTVSGNISRTGAAGGIEQFGGSLLLLDSTVSGNSARNGNGGGVSIDSTTAASTIRRSTIAGNWASNGGGVNLLNSAAVNIQNSTLSGNSASQNGGGLFADSIGVVIQNATVAFNRALVDGGGIHADKAISLASTIVGNNSAPNLPDLASVQIGVFSLRSCLISTTPGAGTVNDLGNNQFNVDPRLAPLASNGGLTQTHALMRSSPAINHGSNPAKLTTDQRGGTFARQVGSAVDVGAFEWTNTPLPPAPTGNFVVSNLNDSGAGSLRQAVINANNHAGPDTIVFKPGLEGTIKLTSGEIFIGGALFLDGPGANKITLDGNQNGRIFLVAPAPGSKVTLDGLTLFNGKTNADGGAIFNNANLHVIGMVITGNTATAFDGGAIYNGLTSNLTIQKSRIIGNTANNGGAIAGSGDTLIEDSTISGNQANLEVGGGIYTVSSGASVTLRRCTVAGNLATTDGGGIFVFINGNLTIENSTIECNQAGRYGGGVNSAASVTRVTDSRIRYNFSESSGGGLAAGSDVQIRRSTVSGNISRTGAAGGIEQFGGSLLLLDSTVSGNSARNGNGGGVYIEATSAASTIRRSTIAANWASYGGGVYVLNSAALAIQNSTISGNAASVTGGGLFADSDGIRLQNATVAFNRADAGGGIFASRAISVESTIVGSNSARIRPDLQSASIHVPCFVLKSSLIATDPSIGSVLDQGNNQFNVDPRLAPLANNGGLTQTHALKKGSAAINRGSNPAGLTTDQRGGLFKRLLGKAVDIGAFERE